MSRIGADKMRQKVRVDGPVSYEHGVGDAGQLEHDRELAEQAAAQPEACVPAFMVVKTRRGYVLTEYALPTSVAAQYLKKQREPDVRSIAIEALVVRLDQEHET